MKEKFLAWLMLFGILLGVVVCVYGYRTMKEAEAYRYQYANGIK